MQTEKKKPYYWYKWLFYYVGLFIKYGYFISVKHEASFDDIDNEQY